ncbi:hypothetical protein BM221_000386 [Beauveria bassiana]|uniref:Stress activated map kinase interacting n=1 Tax=Beauveria bassiana TaxID=176275 RepID=A0A2N6P0B3_BEABA|nr:hypothetical protein BM221_000386 [Beauveria bassiana]
MGLVDYSSESDSSGPEAEAPTKPTPKSKIGGGGGGGGGSSKKVPSVVDKSKAGKIIVNLAGNAANSPSDEPPAKRARTTGGGGGRFFGFNAFLPAPKNTAARSTAGGSRGVGLRTSAAPGFSRDAADVPSITNVDATGDGDEEGDAGRTTTTTKKSGGLSLPPPKNAVAEPTIPEGQKPAAEVKLTGKPLMFRPLSVAKGKPKKKTTTTTTSTVTAKLGPSTDAKSTAAQAPAPSTALPEPPSRKKVSLFSIPSDDTTPAPGPSLSSGTGAYEPLFETAHDDAYNTAAQATEPLVVEEKEAESVGAIADDMNLSAAARRELFGRAGAGSGSGSGTTAQRVVNFNMDREYRHNEALRASGEQQTHNPVRAIQGGGKHSLRQLVDNVQSQKDALEDSFAKGRTNRREASSRYGW